MLGCRRLEFHRAALERHGRSLAAIPAERLGLPYLDAYTRRARMRSQPFSDRSELNLQ